MVLHYDNEDKIHEQTDGIQDFMNWILLSKALSLSALYLKKYQRKSLVKKQMVR
ncbi:MAG: hypothetical protein JXR46_11820 [Calditrichaceae bacterium]|nr:hypothetical protein [Calditrichaceae bacterium]MBN2709722.1 hypothetical protein [Calditrichaceae bacterium]